MSSCLYLSAGRRERGLGAPDWLRELKATFADSLVVMGWRATELRGATTGPAAASHLRSSQQQAKVSYHSYVDYLDSAQFWVSLIPERPLFDAKLTGGIRM